MSHRLLLPGLAFFALALPAAASDQDFKLLNKTGYQIDSVYVGAHSSSEWGRDIMGRDALSDGEAVNITFPHRTSACSFDIKVAYNDGDVGQRQPLQGLQGHALLARWSDPRHNGVAAAVRPALT